MMPRLGAQRGRCSAGLPEQLQGPRVAAAVAGDLVEAGHRLRVVVEDVGPGLDDGLERRRDALEVGDQRLDSARGAGRRTARMVAAQWAAPPSARSSRFTEVITT